MINKRLSFFAFCLLSIIYSAFAQSDTIPSHLLEEVEVEALSIPSAYKASSPVQVLQSKDLEKLNALQVSDAVKFFSGVQVKDYGGIGGLKTVSLRSLGANYTTVAYDGIVMSDYQTGQTDLGRFSLENVGMLTLNIGESDDIFQPARMQALGGNLNIYTHLFQPKNGKKRQEIKASIKAGSFGIINPAVSISKVLSKTYTAGISSEYLTTNGDYPFVLIYGQTDSTTTRKRKNSDVESQKLEANLSGKYRNGGELLVKTHYAYSNRGIPGAVVYYNEYAGERVKDQNVFAQAKYVQALSSRLDFQANAKFTYSDIDYVNYLDSQHNLYYQRESYLNAVLQYKLTDRLSFSWANDGIYGTFSNNFPDCVFPSRTSWMSAVSGKYEQSRFTITASLLNHYINEEVKKGNAAKDKNHLSPYIGFSVQPLAQIPLRLRAFYKNTYRLPTFADMYLSRIQNPTLKAENARQYNTGLTVVSAWKDLLPYFSFSVDAYYNKVENKIVAIPRSSMFIISVLNYGEVDIKGIDLNAKAHVRISSKFLAEIASSYTYQKVTDVTSGSSYYGSSLPYTPRHSASGFATLKMPWFDFNYNLLYCGKRYYTQTQSYEYQLKSYIEQGASLNKEVEWKECRFNFSVECLNIFDKQYEVVRSYPMPERSFRFGIKYIH